LVLGKYHIGDQPRHYRNYERNYEVRQVNTSDNNHHQKLSIVRKLSILPWNLLTIY